MEAWMVMGVILEEHDREDLLEVTWRYNTDSLKSGLTSHLPPQGMTGKKFSENFLIRLILSSVISPFGLPICISGLLGHLAVTRCL
jgi:hypothetical protein